MVKTRRYEVLSCLGRGGFGAVYHARMISVGGFARDVAVKVLREDGPEEVEAVERLRDEARLLGLLRHPNIVQVLQMTRVQEGWAVVMELVSGVSLSVFAKNGQALPPQVVAQIGAEVASALWAAWNFKGPKGQRLRVLHRDIKPSNIQVSEEGFVKVLDFGIASATMEHREAQTGAVVLGTIAFMSPERLRGQDGPEADVYALGATLVELLRGEQWKKAPPTDSLHRDHVATLLQDVHPAHAELALALEKMLSPDPEERPNAGEVEELLRAHCRIFPLPTLRDWARAAVPPLVSEPDLDKAGTTFHELSSDLSGPEPQGTENPVWTEESSVVPRPYPQGHPDAETQAPRALRSPSKPPPEPTAHTPGLAPTPLVPARPAPPAQAAGWTLRQLLLVATLATLSSAGMMASLLKLTSTPTPSVAPAPPQEAVVPVEPEPEPEPEPPPAEEAEEPPPAAPVRKPEKPPVREKPPPADPVAHVTMVGEIKKGKALGEFKTYPLPGELPPGSYRIYGEFRSGPQEAGKLTAEAGKQYALDCVERYGRCNVVKQ